jgi:hypothetical protein
MNIGTRDTAFLLGTRVLAAALCAAGTAVGLATATGVAVADPQNMPPAPPGEPVNQAAAGDSLVPPDGVQHLSSPTNLPPGTTDTGPPESSSVSYLREVWHELQGHNLSMGDALTLLAQRPMTSAPPAGMQVNPQPPSALPPAGPANVPPAGPVPAGPADVPPAGPVPPEPPTDPAPAPSG